MISMITHFRNEYDFLSNFFQSLIEYKNITYPTLEHAYQATKCIKVEDREKIRNSKTPSIAKKLGRLDNYEIEKRKDWKDVSLEIMQELLEIKFSDPILKEKLLKTGDMYLIEGNNWNDKFWGCVWNDNIGIWEGENHLGKLIMKVRDKLKIEGVKNER